MTFRRFLGRGLVALMLCAVPLAGPALSETLRVMRQENRFWAWQGV
jgi:hypothetical protein